MNLNFSLSKAQQLSVGNTTFIDVYVDTGGKEINTIEGSVIISGDAELVSINTVGSVFTLWPNKPSYEKGVVSFVGGTPDAVFGTKLKVFSIAVKPVSTDEIKFSSNDIKLYLADGVGTKIVIDPGSEVFKVNEKSREQINELLTRIVEDKTPPSPFKVELGQDPSVFDGKYFISFSTTDEGAGINRYEVKEGDLPRVRTGTTYVLQSQDPTESIEVYAIDYAGNEQVSRFEIERESVKEEMEGFPWGIVGIVLLLVIVATVVWRRFFKK